MPTGNLNLKTKWGPFSPTYLGISHIIDAAHGSMADIALFAGERKSNAVVLPDNNFGYVQNIKSGERRADVSVMPEEVAADYSSYSLRYFLDEHGDTAVAKFTVESDEQIRCAITFHNASKEERSYFYGLGLAVNDTRKKVLLKGSLKPWWLAARNYTGIEAYQKAFGLGCRQCLTRIFTWGIEDEVLAQAFGGWADDRVTYRTTLPKPLQNGFVYFRYIKYGVVNQTWELTINGKKTTFSFPQTWAIPGGGWGKNRDAYEEWRLLRVPVGCVSESNVNVELRPLDAPGNDLARIWMDGMLFSEGRIAGDEQDDSLLSAMLIDEPLRKDARVAFETNDRSTSTFQIIIQDKAPLRTIIAADEIHIQAQGGTGSLLAHLRKRFDFPALPIERDSMMCPWGLVESGPVIIPALSEKTVSFTISINTTASNSFISTNKNISHCSDAKLSGPYADMDARLRDLLLFNVNYPLQLFGPPSPYYLPAKYFPLPYSWDGGFTAMGLAAFAPDLALQQASYFMADKEHDFPYLYCGSPVPTQLYAIWEIYQSTYDKSVLLDSYSGAKRMYDFYLGRTQGSIVNANNDGMLSTYPYNYNLGIDDHPIQRWAEECQITSKGLYSLILMAQILRIARIMRNIAHLLKNEADTEQYRLDAALLADIIDNRMWDEKSGLYGWLYRTDNGVEPMLLDACAGDRSACAFLPLFAGTTTHKERLIKQMMDPSRFLTPFGISSVDMSAPSYNPQGYWNGGIWPVMQWYLWRGLLESGEPGLARQVAETILKTWTQSFEKDHYLGEHFMIATEQMNGAPNFGGLSAVLLPMCAAYFERYKITTCYDVIILDKTIDYDNDTLCVSIAAPFLVAESHDLLVNMKKGNTLYKVILNGQLYGESVSDEYGHISIRLPRPSGHDDVLVSSQL